jgi:hypothetical protein
MSTSPGIGCFVLMAAGGPDSGRRRRVTEELGESGLQLDGFAQGTVEMLIDEVDLALRPAIHERRVPTSGTIIDPQTDPAAWSSGTLLEMSRTSLGEHPLADARRFADGLSSWLVRRSDGTDEWVVFDRPAGSERDLVVLADAFAAVLVQRHPTGTVRIVGTFGVLRWDGYSWHHEPPVRDWIDIVTACPDHGDPAVLYAMLEFAVHDLGAAGIGALLVYRPNADSTMTVQERLPTPPPLDIRRPSNLAPIRHALSQVDGASVFDHEGVLRQLGVRLVPSVGSEEAVDALGGMRHTSAVRYSADDPLATIIAVSEDGPVTVLRAGTVVGRSDTLTAERVSRSRSPLPRQ